MPETTTDTNESSSTVLSCDNSSQDVENSKSNAKYSNESKLLTCPPPLSFDDIKVETPDSTESNNKSDNSSVNQPLVSTSISKTTEIKTSSREIEKCLSSKDKVCAQLDKKNFGKQLTNCESETVFIGKNCTRNNEEAGLEGTAASQVLQMPSTFCGTQNASSETVIMPLTNFCSSSASIPEENCNQSSSTHPTGNLSYQPSFSDLQDEYLHQICSRIGSNIQSDAFVPDIITHGVPGNVDGNICVINPQTFQGADSFLSMNKPITPHLSPHDKSAWSSTSSIATRPNTDNSSSMSKFTTRFGSSGRMYHEGNRKVSETGASESKGHMTGEDNKSNLEMSTLSSNLQNASAEASRNKKDIIAFKSTAV